MTWNTTAPDGTKSVKANETILQANTSYILTTQQRDHYWNEDANNDGHHKKIELPDIVNINSDPFSLDANGDPTVLSTGQDCMYYTRPKTATEATVSQIMEPFAYTIKDPGGTPVNQYMQLGFRAMIHWVNNGNNPFLQADVVYSHNIALQAAGTPGLVRNGQGDYTITFANAMPSQYYVVFGGAIRNASDTSPIQLQVKPSTNVATTNMTATSVRIVFLGSDDGVHDPLRAWMAVCGG